MGKVIRVPMDRQKCLGESQKRMNGMQVCKIEVNVQMLIELAKGIGQTQSKGRQSEGKVNEIQGENSSEVVEGKIVEDI